MSKNQRWDPIFCTDRNKDLISRYITSWSQSLDLGLTMAQNSCSIWHLHASCPPLCCCSKGELYPSIDNIAPDQHNIYNGSYLCRLRETRFGLDSLFGCINFSRSLGLSEQVFINLIIHIGTILLTPTHTTWSVENSLLNLKATINWHAALNRGYKQQQLSTYFWFSFLP